MDDSQDVERHSGNELIARQATFQFGYDQPRGRRQVLLAGLPGALRMQGRNESALPEANIVGIRVFSACATDVSLPLSPLASGHLHGVAFGAPEPAVMSIACHPFHLFDWFCGRKPRICT